MVFPSLSLAYFVIVQPHAINKHLAFPSRFERSTQYQNYGQSVPQFTCQSVCLSVCLSICVYVCPASLSLSFWQKISLSARLHNTKEQSATNELLILRQQLPSRLRTRALVRIWQRKRWRLQKRQSLRGKSRHRTCTWTE